MKRQYNISLFSILSGIIIASIAYAQSGGEGRWVLSGQMNEWISEQGCFVEAARIDLCNDDWIWPAEYGRNMRNGESRTLVIMTKQYFDNTMQTTFPYKVVQAGPTYNSNMKIEFFNNTVKLIGKFLTPNIYVDNVPNHYLDGYDEVDEVDETMKPERKVINEMNSQIGVHVKREVFGYSNPKIDDVIFHDYVFTNNGIVDKNGTTVSVTLEDVYFTFVDRLAFAGEGNPGTDYESGFAQWEATWGNSNIFHYFNPNKILDTEHPYLRGYYCYYGPFSGSDLTADEQWGLPDHEPQLPDNPLYHRMAAGNYTGKIVLHADRTVDDTSDDPNQPAYYPWYDSDLGIMLSIEPYNANLMTNKFNLLTGGSNGHPGVSQQEYMEENGITLPESIPGWVGGVVQAFTFGPYQMKPGDDVHIVMADAVNGLSREKNREVAFNWYQYYKGTGKNPTLILPDNTPTTDHNGYKKAWVETCLDSLIQSFDAALEAYADGAYDIPEAPPPSEQFLVQSGGTGVVLKWTPDAESMAGFDGYEVYRSKNTIASEFTQYIKVLDCNKNDLETKTSLEDGYRVFEDVPDTNISSSDSTVTRGFGYLYYLRSKARATNGDLLKSGMFFNMCGTIEKAQLLRPPVIDNLDSIVVVPNPYIITNRVNQFGDAASGDLYDQIAFYNLPPVCTIKIFTEKGDLIWQKEHTNGAGDDFWNQVNKANMTIVSGIYIVLFEEPNGKSTFRKFIIIR